jgi:AmmeMemoRadiSam system protein A
MLNETERGQLLRLAAEAIHCGLRTGQPPRIDTAPLPAELLRVAASFVTLHHRNRLRGCIGSLEACQPLALNVADNAFNAAFRDPRFAPLQIGELGDLALEISVLGVPEELCCTEEAELIAQLRPGEHGLILEAAGHRGTFLPSVWESLPEPVDFLGHLKQKAGLPMDFWSADMRVQCYQTEAFGAAFSAVERVA